MIEIFQIFFNEHRNHWYSTGSYYLAKNVVELPVVILISYIFSYITYYGVSEPDMNFWYQGFWDVPSKFILFVIIILGSNYCQQGISINKFVY